MTDEPAKTDPTAVATPRGKALSVRALVTGFVLVLLFAAVTPVNDWLLKNTFMYSQHLAIGVFLFVVAMEVWKNASRDVSKRKFWGWWLVTK